MKIVKIGDIFNVIKGKSLYTKTYGMQNKGDFPVFSASNNAPLTFIKSFDFDGKYMTRATNGFAGYIKIIDGRFSINGDRGVLVPKEENISIDYVKFLLEPILRLLAKGRKGDDNENEFTKVYPRMVEQVEIQIPIDEKGNFDLQAQQEIASQYVMIDEFKAKLKEYEERFEKIQVQVQEGGSMREMKLEDLFEIKGGKAIYNSEYINKHKGKYPLYSSNTDNNGIIGYIDSYDHECDGITRSTRGEYAGTFFYRPKHKFSMTGNSGLLTPNKINIIHLLYILYALGNSGKNNTTGEGIKMATKKMISQLTIPIPVLPDGSFDISRQQEIAEIYETIAEVKTNISKKLQELQAVQVVL